MTPRTIALLGGGGHASDALNVIQKMGLLDMVAGCFDDAPDVSRMSRWSVRLLGPLSGCKVAQTDYVLGVGMPAVRMRVLAEIDTGTSEPITLVDPEASVGFGCEIGPGALVLAGARMSPLVVLGQFTYVSQNCSVGHDSVLSDHVAVMPCAVVSGDCQVGRGATIGTGAVILPGLVIGEGAFVGAGAVVTRDVEPGQTVVGSPAKPIRPAEEHQQ